MTNSSPSDPLALTLTTLNRHLVAFAAVGLLVALVAGWPSVGLAWVVGVAGALAYYHLLAKGMRGLVRGRKVPTTLRLSVALAGRQAACMFGPLLLGLYGPEGLWVWAVAALLLARHWLVLLWAVEAYKPAPVVA